MSLFFCFLGVNMGWDANSLSARMLHLLHQFVPDLYSVTLFLPTSSNTLFTIFQLSIMHSVCPQILHKLLLWNTLGRSAYSQEHSATIVYAKFGGQTECIMGNWKIENTASPHEDEQQQRLSSTSITFCGLDKSSALDNALSTLLSSCSQHFFAVRVFASFIHLLPVVTLSDNASKQIAAARSFRMSALLTLKTFLMKVQQI